MNISDIDYCTWKYCIRLLVFPKYIFIFMHVRGENVLLWRDKSSIIAPPFNIGFLGTWEQDSYVQLCIYSGFLSYFEHFSSCASWLFPIIVLNVQAYICIDSTVLKIYIYIIYFASWLFSIKCRKLNQKKVESHVNLFFSSVLHPILLSLLVPLNFDDISKFWRGRSFL